MLVLMPPIFSHQSVSTLFFSQLLFGPGEILVYAAQLKMYLWGHFLKDSCNFSGTLFKRILFLMDHFHFRAGNICGQPWVLAALVPQLSTASSGDKAFLDYPSCGLTQKAPFLFSELRSDSGGFVAPCEWDTVPLGFTTAFSGWAYQTILLKAVSWWSGFILISLSFWETYWI